MRWKAKSRDRRRWYALPVLMVLVVLLAACGDDDDGDAAGEATTPEETGSADRERAEEIVAEVSTRPTSIELTEPVGAEIPPGKTIYFVTCGIEFCDAEAEIIKQATDILDWNLVVLSTDGSPQQIQNAWEQIVRENPDGVLYTGTARAQIDQYITAADANGTAIAACCITDEPTNGIDFVTSTAEQAGRQGEYLAAWVVANSAEGDPSVVYLDIPDLPLLSSLGVEFEASMADLCPDCSLDQLDIGLADLANASDQIVSYLRANEDVKHVVMSTSSPFVGLPPALDAAGLTDVKLIGTGPSSANLQMISQGVQDADMYFAVYEAMFGMVDAVARVHAGVPVVPAFDPPNWLVTKENLPSATEFFPMVPDIVEVFKVLWGKA